MVVRPIYSAMTETLSAVEREYSALLGEKTGLKVTYRSLSPSIFSGIRIRGIEVTEIETGSRILGIRNASLSYSFRKFTRESPLSAVELLTVSGVTFEYDAVRNSALLERILQLAKNDGKTEGGGSPGFWEEFRLPFDVSVKDISLHYSDLRNDLSAALRSLDFEPFDSALGGIKFTASGEAKFGTDFLMEGKRRALCAAQFSLSGTFFPGLDGSSATVSLSESHGADYTVGGLNALVSYEDEKLQLRTMRTAFPFSLFSEFDFSRMAVSANFKSENLDPLKVVKIRSKNEILRKIDGSTISGTASGSFEFGTNSAKYDTNVSLNLSPRLVGERMRIACSASGTEKNVRFRRLSADSRSLGAVYSGSLDFRTLQPFGTLELGHYTLPNGSIVSAEAFLEPSGKGVFLFAPQVFLNAKALTGLQASVFPGSGFDSFDFSVSVSDYARAEEGVAGSVSVDGSLILGRKNFLQASASFSDIFADSVLEAVQVFLPQKNADSLDSVRNSVAPYVASGEFYFSTDFSDFTYNVPYAFVANFFEEGQIAAFSADGSAESVSVSSLDLQYAGQSVHASASLSFASGFDNIAFDTDLTFNSMPYSFYGNVTPEWISVSGDYGFDSIISLNDGISGFFQFTNFPLSLGDFTFALSTMSTFSYTNIEDFSVAVARFEAAELSGLIPISPRISFSGELVPGNFSFSALTYSDNVSELDMGGSVLWSVSDGILDGASVELYGQNPLSSEKIGITAQMENPRNLEFSLASFLNDYYASASVSVDSFPASRLLDGQDEDDTINFELNATGTISNPFVSLEVSRASLNLSGYQLDAHGNAVLDEGRLSLMNAGLSWAFFDVSDIGADVDLRRFSGRAEARAAMSLAGNDVSVPLDFSLESAVDEGDTRIFRIPEFYTVTASSKDARISLFSRPVSFVLNMAHIPGRLEFSTDNPDGFKASVAGNTFTAHPGANAALNFDLEGSLSGGEMDILVRDLSADLKEICSVVEIPFVEFTSGTVNGNVRISGNTSDPEFTGFVDVENLSMLVPLLSKYPILSDALQISSGSDGITLPETLFTSGKARFNASADVKMNRWGIDSVSLNLKTLGKRGIPVDMELPFIHASGEAIADLSLSVTLPNFMDVRGSVRVNNSDVEIVMSEMQNQLSFDGLLNFFPDTLRTLAGLGERDSGNPEPEGVPFEMNVVASLDFIVGNNVRVMFNPFMRTLLAPETPLSFYMDSLSGEFSIAGDVTLQGGEVSWLNRNFYMKEGRIVFNENQDSIDPRVTLRAETRETDDEGKRVTISLSVPNQPLSQISPVFSATPAKSEAEIMALLGQVISADSDSFGSLVTATGDYLVQATVVREIENTLRELLNLDILSVRTNVIQNALGQNSGAKSDGAAADSETDSRITFGNFFDNSTVYIGKYFGSAIYTDAMLHWTYDRSAFEDGTSATGLLFQPEFGFEMASPFVNIRLGVAPDIDSVLQNQWVTSSFITLSWKHSF